MGGVLRTLPRPRPVSPSGRRPPQLRPGRLSTHALTAPRSVGLTATECTHDRPSRPHGDTMLGMIRNSLFGSVETWPWQVLSTGGKVGRQGCRGPGGGQHGRPHPGRDWSWGRGAVGGTVTGAAFRLGPPCTGCSLWEGGERAVRLSQTTDSGKDPSWRVGHRLLSASFHLSVPNHLNFSPLTASLPLAV